jgi:transketolase
MPTVKPLDLPALQKLAEGARLVVTVEEHTVIGGLGSAVTDALVAHLDGNVPRMRKLGIPDVFAQDYGSQEWLMESFGINAPQIAEMVRKAVAA